MVSQKRLSVIGLSAVIACLALPVHGKDKVKVGFIGPLTGGTAANGLGGRNSADLAVKLRNADPKAKYEYELVVLDDECKPNVAVQVATKAGADRTIIASASHYCSVAAIAAVETYQPARAADGGVGRGAAGHHLSQQVSGGAPGQRHDDQPERDRREFMTDRVSRNGWSFTTPPTTARATTSTSPSMPRITAGRSPAPSASLPTSRISPPSSPRARRSLPRSSTSAVSLRSASASVRRWTSSV